MSNPFTEPEISGYNDTPPSDDGANTASNEITWAKHKTKLSDPIKNWVDALISNVTTAFSKSFLNAADDESSNFTVVTGDRGKLFVCSNTITATLPVAASVGEGFAVSFYNDGAGTVTLDGNSSETINGATTLALSAGDFAILVSDGDEWFASKSENIGISSLAKTDGNFIVGNGTSWVAESGSTARTSLGLGTIATENSPLPIASGGTGQTGRVAALNALGVYAGIVNSSGSGISLPFGWTSSTGGTGIFTVTHGLGQAGYVVALTVQDNANRTAVISDRGVNSFTYLIYKCDDGSLQDEVMHFILYDY